MVGMDAAVVLATMVTAMPAAPSEPPPQRPQPSSGPARTLGAAVRRAHLARDISWAQRRAYERDLKEAKAAARRLPAARARQIRGALLVGKRLAARGMLGAERLEPVVAGIRASTDVFRLRPFPAPGQRLEVGGDGLVYEFRPGSGVQLHPLASAGRLNALATACLHDRDDAKCRPAATARAADALVDVAVRDGRELRFEYLFSFGRGSAPWTSAMAQATATQALARAGRVTGSRRHDRAATAAFRGLVRGETAVRGRGGVARFAMYSFQPGMRVLNGELQTLVGLADYARLSGRREARRVLGRTARRLAGELRRFDTGAWTLYNAGGREATLHYHRLAARFADRACRRGLPGDFCPAASRYARYTREPPALQMRVEKVIRTGRRVKVVLRASKRASGRLVARGPRGAVQQHAVSLGRQPVAVRFAATRWGSWRLDVTVVAVNGKRATARATVLAKPKPKPKPKRKRDRRTAVDRDAGRRDQRKAAVPKAGSRDRRKPADRDAGPGDRREPAEREERPREPTQAPGAAAPDPRVSPPPPPAGAT